MEHDEFKETSRERLFGFVLEEKLDKKYVAKDGEWNLVKLLVFGCAGLILTSVILALAAFALSHKIV